jgi:hypothetical protein
MPTRTPEAWLEEENAIEELFPGLKAQLNARTTEKKTWEHRDGKLFNLETNSYLHPNTTIPDLEYEQSQAESWLQNSECMRSSDIQTIKDVLQRYGANFSQKGFKNLGDLRLASIHDSGDDLQAHWAGKELWEYLQTHDHSLSDLESDHRGGLLLVYGIGQGSLIAKMIGAVQPRIVVIFEPDEELLGTMLHSEACNALLETTKPLGCSTFLITDSDPNLAKQKAMGLIELENLYCLERIFSMHFRHADWCEKLTKLMDARDSMLRNLRYLGFFVDELHMQLNSSICLTQNPPRIISHNLINEHEAHAVITASGPSLTESLPLLKQFREQYHLFGCYSTLGTLLKSAIQPDYHCNQERHADHLYILEDPASAAYVTSALLLCSANNDPRMNRLYRDAVAFWRSASCASALYATSTSECLRGEGPQVANLALNFAILMGYRTIHLFGVDLGCVDQAQARVAGALAHTDRTMSIAMPGNRRPTIWTDHELIECAEYMGNLINGTLLPNSTPIEGLKVFNYSDGQAIPGTISADPASFTTNLQAHPAGPAPIELVAMLNRYDSQIARARFIAFDWRGKLAEYLGAVRRLIAEPLNREMQEQFMQLSERQINNLRDQVLPRMFAGTLSRIWFLILKVDECLQFSSEVEQREWESKAHSILNQCLESMEKLVLEMVNYVENLEKLGDHQLRSCTFSGSQ